MIMNGQVLLRDEMSYQTNQSSSARLLQLVVIVGHRRWRLVLVITVHVGYLVSSEGQVADMCCGGDTVDQDFVLSGYVENPKLRLRTE